MNAERERDYVADLTLERYRLGELSPDEHERIRARLERDNALRSRLEMFEESDRQIRAGDALETLAARIRTSSAAGPAGERGHARLHQWMMPAAAAALVVLAVIVVPKRATAPGALPAPRVATPSAGNEDRIKGLRPALAVYRQTARGSEALADGDVARAGDVVRVGYRAAGRSYGVILSIDGRGAVTLHLPAGGGAAVPLQGRATVLLDRAYELDDAPRFEKFYFVTSEQPFESASIVEAARRAAARASGPSGPPLPLSREFEQSTFSLQKEPRS